MRKLNETKYLSATTSLLCSARALARLAMTLVRVAAAAVTLIYANDIGMQHFCF